jgi:penicillin-binding protein 2
MAIFNPKNDTGQKLKFQKVIGFEEAFLDMQNEDAETLEVERQQINYRFIIFVIAFGMIVLLSRIFYLQVISSPYYRSLAEGNKLRVQYIYAPRGLILDNFGKIIATNTASFKLTVSAQDLPKDNNVLTLQTNQVALVLNLPKEDVAKKISELKADIPYPQILYENISKDQALKFLSDSDKHPAFFVENSSIRLYNDPLVFAHLVGYTGRINEDEYKELQNKGYLFSDYIGKTGLEVQYEQYFRGTPGKKQIEINAMGEQQKRLAEIPPAPGNNLVLNIDYDLQKIAYESVNKYISKTRAKKAAVVATEPKTGKVLALISLPSYDGNMFAKGISSDDYKNLKDNDNHPLIDRVITGVYPPGSTVKPMLACAALAEGVVKPETKILDDGVIRIGSYTFYGYRREGLGLMDIYSAIARSSDIYFYTIGGGNPKSNITPLGPEKIAQWYRKFSLGKILGIDLPGEKPGLVPDEQWKKEVKNEEWYLGNTYHISIGQGDLLTTPLQVNSWTATIANNGVIMKPYIVSKAVSKDNQVVFEQQPEIISQTGISQEILDVVQKGMSQTITVGSAQLLKNLPITIAGKTGTAQFDAKNLNLTHAWFTSYAPFENPKIALTILIESGGEGSSIAVPIAKDIYQWYAKNRLQQTKQID